jgi:hypothetical protein
MYTLLYGWKKKAKRGKRERAAKCYSVTNENGEYGFQITLSAWQCSADTLVVSPHHKILFDYFVTS